jgi:hypothetical protein
VAWVSRAISGSATFNEATADTTVARDRQTTNSTRPWRRGLSAAVVAGVGVSELSPEPPAVRMVVVGISGLRSSRYFIADEFT